MTTLKTAQHTKGIIPDLWEISFLPELKGYTLGGTEAGQLIRDCWHTAHNLKKQNQELVEALGRMVRAFNVDKIDPLVAFATIEQAKAALSTAHPGKE